jgi:hypothetical protein
MRDWTAEELDRIGAADAAIDHAYQTKYAR